MDKNHPQKSGSLQLQIGNRLKGLRNEKGLTQRELAARVKGGVDYTYIGKIERGKQLPSLKVLSSISEMLSVPIDYFFRCEAETIVYVNDVAELGFLLRDEKGRELLTTLRLLQERDIPLIMEIIKILARHGNIESGQLLAESGTAAEELLLVAEEKAPYLEK
ncbi:MAG TPA: helix-turn-helix transcriptional regulator [Geobacteraceae bacterium]